MILHKYYDYDRKILYIGIPKHHKYYEQSRKIVKNHDVLIGVNIKTSVDLNVVLDFRTSNLQTLFLTLLRMTT